MHAGFFRRFAALFCCLCVLFLCAVPSAAAGRRTVRIGLVDSVADNRTVAFEKDYFQAVAEYAGWDYVFVPAAWADCLRMLRDGELDLLMDVTKTDERMEYFDFSAESMGTEMCYVYGRSDTTLQYGSAASFDGITVGYEAGSTILDSLTEYAGANHFSFTAKSYPDAAAMFAALDSGEVDAVVQTNFYDTPENHVILAKLDPTPVYFATCRQDPSLKRELDDAMAQLFSYNPGFNTDLFEYHFGAKSAQSIGFTEEETAYLAAKPVVNVYYETNWAPFEWDQNGVAEGITPDVIRAIGEDTGIDFRFVLSSSTQTVYQGVGASAADTVMAVSYDYTWASDHDLLVTQPYVTGSVIRVQKDGAAAPKSVAIVSDGYLASKISEAYAGLTPVPYQTFSECMDAVAHGRADCVFLNYYQASYYRSMSAYANFSYQPDGSLSQNISLGVTKDSNPLLFSVLSKSLQRLSANQLQRILSDNVTQPEPVTMRTLLRRYPVEAVLLFALLGSLLGVLVILLVSSSTRKRQNIQLAAAKQEAEAASNAKSDFLSRMSHDMRTPLNGIIGMTYLTKQMDLPEEAQQNLEKVSVSSKFLLALINDLLDMAKVESGKLELKPEPYPPEKFRMYLDAVIRPLCDGKHQTFCTQVDIPEDCVPLVDKLRLNQIVFNLLSNAVKYTGEGGTIRYSSRTVPTADGRLSMEITVADNGIGMSEAFRKQLFTPFSQEGRDDNSELRGSGLGLAITKRLVDRMGGEISVQSAPGQGTTFTVLLTVDRAPAAKKEDAAKEASAAFLAGRSVLLCEDHPLNQEIACALLRQRGLRVTVAENGQRGVELFRDSPPGTYDAILMDIRMPVLDGYGATRAIRALDRPDAKTIPILAMSADVLSDDIRKCLAAGMNGHIAKPVDPGTIFQKLADAIRAAQ